jgi:REP element-mobilizing transposase RayT
MGIVIIWLEDTYRRPAGFCKPRRSGDAMTKPILLYPGSYYHIYNRGNNREDIFLEEKNYGFFLERYAEYIEPAAFTYAYCLLKNHFHLLVRIRTEEEQREYFETCGVSKTPQVFRALDPSRQFGHLFNSYAKSINKAYGQTGSLFEGRFKRVCIESHDQLVYLVTYIHRNPKKHGVVEDLRDWNYSSYASILSDKPTRLQRNDVLACFGGREGFEDGHWTERGERFEHLTIDDDL